MDRCESCGMPLDDPEQVSKVDQRYCVYCQNQETGELATREQVREGSVRAMMRIHGVTREEAEAYADEELPKLPRWRQ